MSWRPTYVAGTHALPYVSADKDLCVADLKLHGMLCYCAEGNDAVRKTLYFWGPSMLCCAGVQ